MTDSKIGVVCHGPSISGVGVTPERERERRANDRQWVKLVHGCDLTEIIKWIEPNTFVTSRLPRDVWDCCEEELRRAVFEWLAEGPAPFPPMADPPVEDQPPQAAPVATIRHASDETTPSEWGTHVDLLRSSAQALIDVLGSDHPAIFESFNGTRSAWKSVQASLMWMRNNRAPTADLLDKVRTYSVAFETCLADLHNLQRKARRACQAASAFLLAVPQNDHWASEAAELSEASAYLLTDTAPGEGWEKIGMRWYGPPGSCTFMNDGRHAVMPGYPCGCSFRLPDDCTNVQAAIPTDDSAVK